MYEKNLITCSYGTHKEVLKNFEISVLTKYSETKFPNLRFY